MYVDEHAHVDLQFCVEEMMCNPRMDFDQRWNCRDDEPMPMRKILNDMLRGPLRKLASGAPVSFSSLHLWYERGTYIGPFIVEDRSRLRPTRRGNPKTPEKYNVFALHIRPDGRCFGFHFAFSPY